MVYFYSSFKIWLSTDKQKSYMLNTCPIFSSL